MFNCWRLALAGTLLSASGLCGYAQAQTAGREICPRPVPNGVIAEPEDLRSEQGSLSVDLVFRNQLDEQGRMRYCYVDKNENESPTIAGRLSLRETDRRHLFSGFPNRSHQFQFSHRHHIHFKYFSLTAALRTLRKVLEFRKRSANPFSHLC
jgi:hypothetical protein